MKDFPHSSAVESILRERIGFGAYPGGTVDRCVNRRMQACGIEDGDAYLSFLCASRAEQDELIEEIVVPETWFFRDCEPFVYLRKYAAEKILSCGPQTPLRALSVPASTGEEAYSIAITLLEAGLTPDRFCVHAVDISRRALQKAGEALYGSSSFREKDSDLLRKYFDEAGSMFLVRPEIREAVRFTQGNVLQETDLGSEESCDIVFFRNLLIYLDEASRKTAIRNVERVLKKGGLLVLGYAEPQHLFFPDYIPADHPRAHASRKPPEKEPDRRESLRPVRMMPPRGSAHVSKKPSGSLPVDWRRAGILHPEPQQHEKLGPAPPEEIFGILSRAHELADSGMYMEAEKLVGECLKSDMTCTEAHYLLGITALARGDEETAATHLNRVIYLDPNHNDALLHLSLLMERFGLREQAARYRKRIDRTGKDALPEIDG